MTYVSRVTRLTILPETEAIYSEMATEVSIVDESAGEFVEVEQHGRSDLGKIAINPDEWPALKAAIDQMIEACRKGEEDGREA